MTRSSQVLQRKGTPSCESKQEKDMKFNQFSKAQPRKGSSTKKNAPKNQLASGSPKPLNGTELPSINPLITKYVQKKRLVFCDTVPDMK